MQYFLFCGFFFFFNDTATTEIYTLSLHDALPIFKVLNLSSYPWAKVEEIIAKLDADRKSTRLNSSHVRISYAVFCLKKKKIQIYVMSKNKITKQAKGWATQENRD